MRISGASSGFMHRKYFSKRCGFGRRGEVVNLGHSNLRVGRRIGEGREDGRECEGIMS